MTVHRRELTVHGADGVTLAVVEVGPADAPALALAHGVGSSGRFLLESFATPVLAAGWRLVAYDLRGHGASAPVRDPAGHTLDRHVEDLHAVVEAVGARLVGGVSLGGHAAVGYVARGGDVDAVLACLPAWTGQAAPGEGPHAAVAAEVRELGIPALVARFRADTAMAPWLRRVLVRDWPTHDAASLVAALVALDGALAPSDAELAALTVPLAVVGWPDDPGHPLDTARRWVERAPRAHLSEITLTAMDGDLTALGRAAVAVLTAALRDGSGSELPFGEDGLGGA